MADEDKVTALAGMGRPMSVSALRTLLGASFYLRRFIPDFSDLTRPLRVVQGQFPSKHSEIPDSAWNPECQRAFEGLKAALVSALVLAFPDFSKTFIIYVPMPPTTSWGQSSVNGLRTAPRDPSLTPAARWMPQSRSGASRTRREQRCCSLSGSGGHT